MSHKEEILTVDEAAELLRVAPLTIRRWIWSGRLKAQQMMKNSPIRINKKELLKASQYRPKK